MFQVSGSVQPNVTVITVLNTVTKRRNTDCRAIGMNIMAGGTFSIVRSGVYTVTLF